MNVDPSIVKRWCDKKAKEGEREQDFGARKKLRKVVWGGLVGFVCVKGLSGERHRGLRLEMTNFSYAKFSKRRSSNQRKRQLKVFFMRTRH